MRVAVKELLFLFLFLLASCGDGCNCNNLSIDPFNSSPQPNGCGCSVGKIYVPDIGVDITADATPTKGADMHNPHKVK